MSALTILVHRYSTQNWGGENCAGQFRQRHLLGWWRAKFGRKFFSKCSVLCPDCVELGDHHLHHDHDDHQHRQDVVRILLLQHSRGKLPSKVWVNRTVIERLLCKSRLLLMLIMQIWMATNNLNFILLYQMLKTMLIYYNYTLYRFSKKSH